MKSKTCKTFARKWGESIGCVIKPKVVKKLDIKPNDAIEITVRVHRD